MKNQDFLIKLVKQKKIVLVESSEEISQSYLVDSKSYFSSARILFLENKLKEVTQLVYFSVYYSVLSLLFKVEIKSETHFGSIILLKEIFNIDNSFPLFLMKKRVGTYYPDFKIENKLLEELMSNAEEFNSIIFDFISKLDLSKINLYRKNFSEVFGLW